ncbi:MAG TPA: YdcP family protein [Candidatus Mediterraneibacter norfolkensis]|nr:YdcP family protein [Candidatus Mediterraneibacter norfolkensis]
MIKYVVPDMEKTFGVLTFAGMKEETTTRVNRMNRVTGREYSLYSSVQRADDVSVRLPGKAGAKNFAYEQKVQLVNPKITAEGYSIDGRGYSRYILTADDMIPANK